MPIALGTNIASLQAQQRLGEATDALARSYQRLSSGQRINQAADDAAGLAIVSQLNSKARVFTQAVRNVNDGVSASNIAEGALNALKTISQRQLELSEEAANGTYSIKQRGALNTEANALVDEYNRIVSTTTFNGLSLLDPALGTVLIQAGYGQTGALQLNLSNQLERPVGDGTFQSAVSYQTGGVNTADVVVGDVNGDGKADLVTADYTSGSISLMLGNGDGTFQTATDLTDTGGNFNVQLGDVNGDGHLDILFASYNDDDLGVFINNGNGTFQALQAYLITGDAPQQIALADLNNDGHLDAITGGRTSSSDSVSVFFGNSDGTFQADQVIQTPAFQPFEIATGDLLGNGITDIITADYGGADPGSGGIGILFGDGKGNFTSSSLLQMTSGKYPESVAVGDFNGDGVLDIAAVGGYGSNNDTDIFLGNGNGTFKTPLSIPSLLTGPAHVTIGDLNGDGKEDLVVTHMYGNRNGYTNEEIQTYLGNGNGTFKLSSSQDSAGGSPWMPALGDFNNDGRLDIATADWNAGSDDVSILLANGGYSSATPYLNINTAQGARDALNTVTANLNRVEAQLGAIGATTSRFQAELGNLQTETENFDAAAGRIQDTDVAQETANLTRTQILQQAAASVLAQANQEPRLALTLLGGG